MYADDNPNKVGTASTPVLDNDDGSSQMKRYKEEEKNQKAPKILPHEMQMFVEVLSQVFVDMTKLRGMLNQAKNKPNVNQRFVTQLVDKIDKVNQGVLEISEDLDKLAC